jgi:immune inhibitor A
MEGSDRSGKTVWMIVGSIILLLCCCVLILSAGGVALYDYFKVTEPGFTQLPATIDGPTDEPTPSVVITRPPVEDIPLDTLQLLQQTEIPENDPYDLACRLRGICDVPRTFEGPSSPRQVGEKDQFWVFNHDTITHFQIEATLRYVTPHVYFWAEDGIRFDENELKKLIDTFENEIYPTDREFFGSEWTPGVDGDPHIYVLYANNLGFSVAGYFASNNSYNPLVSEYSNAHETYVLSATQNLGVPYTYSTLAHEFVHMIQFNSDHNDDTWMTEGFAEVGSFINGYDVGGWDWAYVGEPDLQLTDWSAIPGTNGPHYGQSFLYLAYYMDRFGSEATRALNTNPENGLKSVDDTLEQLKITDPQTGDLITADDVFIDWAVAMFLQDKNVGDGRYVYHNYADAPRTYPTETISSCPSGPLGRNVYQYGIDYISVDCKGDFTLHFEGSTVASLLPEDPYSGEYAFWSNKGDESDMTLTHGFDFDDISGPITLSYHTWYDLEEGYDYLHLEISEDDGQSWQILTTPSGTGEDSSGNSYGWGYTGKSAGWILEEVDLSKYAGKKVWVRFEYVTDEAVNGEGLLLDDISVDAVDYFTDFETDDGGWIAEGFVRIQNALPQTFRLALIKTGASTSVEMIDVNADQTAEIPLSIGGDVDYITLVVSGTTRYTRDVADYNIEIK